MKLSLFLLFSLLVLLSPEARSADGKPSSAPVVGAADQHDELRRILELSRGALASLQPIKTSLTINLERYREEQRKAPSETVANLIERHEAQLQQIRSQEREVRQTMASIEARLAEAKKAPAPTTGGALEKREPAKDQAGTAPKEKSE